MRTKLLYAPLALPVALALPSPAHAAPCERVYLMTGDMVQVCVDAGGCTVDVFVGLNPPGPKSYTCVPYPAGSPPYCDGVVGDVTLDTCLLDPSCPLTSTYVFVYPSSTTVCL